MVLNVKNSKRYCTIHNCPFFYAKKDAHVEIKTVNLGLLSVMIYKTILVLLWLPLSSQWTGRPKKNCKLSDWSKWSKCKSSCGNGTRERKRFKIEDHDKNGKKCDKLFEQEPCNTGRYKSRFSMCTRFFFIRTP